MSGEQNQAGQRTAEQRVADYEAARLKEQAAARKEFDERVRKLHANHKERRAAFDLRGAHSLEAAAETAQRELGHVIDVVRAVVDTEALAPAQSWTLERLYEAYDRLDEASGLAGWFSSPAALEAEDEAEAA